MTRQQCPVCTNSYRQFVDGSLAAHFDWARRRWCPGGKVPTDSQSAGRKKNGWVTIEEAVEATGKSRATIYALIARDGLGRRTAGRRQLVGLAELRRAIARTGPVGRPRG